MDVRLDALRSEAPLALMFFEGDLGFAPPQEIADGLRYERPGMTIEIIVWTWNKETGFSTRLSTSRPDGVPAAASLDDVYVSLGLGPAQDGGSSAQTGHTVRKRVHEHAAALRKVTAAIGVEQCIERLSARQ